MGLVVAVDSAPLLAVLIPSRMTSIHFLKNVLLFANKFSKKAYFET
jgi:hypothetical protein